MAPTIFPLFVAHRAILLLKVTLWPKILGIFSPRKVQKEFYAKTLAPLKCYLREAMNHQCDY